MNDETKIRQELTALRQRVKELEQSESEWKREREDLKKSEARFRSYFDLDLHGIAITSPEKGWIQVNDRLCSIMGYSREEIIRSTWSEMTHPDDLAADLDQFARLMSGQIDKYSMEKRFIRKDGQVVWTNLSAGCVRKPDGSVDHNVAVVEDITASKLAERKLRESEDRYRSLFDNSIDAILLTAPDGSIFAANSEACRIFGRTEEEICRIGRAGVIDQTDPRLADALATRDRTSQFRGELRLIRKDGTSFPGEITSVIFRDRNNILKTSMIIRDITERKRTEAALIKSEEIFRKTFHTSPDAVSITRLEDGTYISINPAFTRITGFVEAEIIGKSSVDYNIWNNIEDRQRLVAGLEKDGEVTNLDAAFQAKGGDIRYGLTSASLIDLDGVPHILSLTRDITEREQMQEQLQHTLESLRTAFGATIQVLVSAVESRDPYTAGHQLRSADLARAIATEMRLPHEIIDGIRMAGSIHDIGKLSIPSEILTKPTKLTAIEFSLIKEHAQKGFEMLKDVKSPWPLAEIVYQHHERIDGSGYPRQLKGERILIEARIMAVADVVESMAAHRPYRPALGIEAALEEIEKNRGILYDENVADACLRLFREKGFQIKKV